MSESLFNSRKSDHIRPNLVKPFSLNEKSARLTVEQTRQINERIVDEAIQEANEIAST